MSLNQGRFFAESFTHPPAQPAFPGHGDFSPFFREMKKLLFFLSPPCWTFFEPSFSQACTPYEHPLPLAYARHRYEG